MTPKEFGDMTVREFYAKLRGFSWKLKLDQRGRAEIIAAVCNASPNRKRGSPAVRVDRLCPIINPPKNIFFRQIFGLSW
jgi:hypothetical protein